MLRRTARNDTTVRAYKYRLYPNKDQSTMLCKTFGCARKVYNLLLSERLSLYEQYKNDLTQLNKQQYSTPAVLKQSYPYLSEVDSLALANAQCNLAAAFGNFFAGRADKPVYKKKRSKQSYTTNNQKGSVRIESGRLRLPKIGFVKIKLHRELPTDGVIKSVTVSLTPTGKFFASIFVETEAKPAKRIVPEKVLGLDYSSPELYVDNQGTVPGYQRYFRKLEAKLAKEQRKLSRMKKFSKNWYKQKRKVAKIHEKIANLRKDFLDKLSYKLAEEYDAIAVEDLDMRAMSQRLHLGKSTYDNGFGQFRHMLEYKLHDRGKQLVVVDQLFPSSKRCSICGYKNAALRLEDRVWTCPQCGTVLDRDVNAAVNLRLEGIEILNRGTRGDSLSGETLHTGIPVSNRKPPMP